MLYMDHSATTPPHPDVVDAIADCMLKFYGNPSSVHRIGLEAEKLLNRAREVIAAGIGAQSAEIIFTSGGTESNNLAIKGAAYAYRQRGNHLITTQIEHASVYESFRQLEAEGFRVTYLPVDASGSVLLDKLEEALTEETILVSIMHVNNETGRIQPVEEAGRMLRKRPRTLFHIDAVQSLGKLPIKTEQLGADLISCSAHKLRGPKGAGFLYKKQGIGLYPLLAGGGQEQGFRSGTENVPLIVGMAKAVRMAVEHQSAHAEQLYKLRERLVNRLRALDGVLINGKTDNDGMAPHIVHVSVPGMKSETVVHALEQRQIYISTRSACSSGDEKPSRVLSAMSMDARRASSGLRISFSTEETEADMDFFAGQLEEALGCLVGSRR